MERRPNIRVAAALVEIDEADLADEVLRQQAKIGDTRDYDALTRLAGRFNLASTQLWLSHNRPAGTQPALASRYPAPDWTPDGGWRVDKSLVYAHTLQESRFRTSVVSPAGAYGLMQIRPIAATDITRSKGIVADRAALTRPSTNLEVGQSYIEQLRDQPFTGGLLPKVIAAYNAGPTPVAAWNSVTHDGGDPLLYIESIPYWETRGLRHDGAAQLLDLRGPNRQGIVEPRRAGAGHVAQISRPAWGSGDPHGRDGVEDRLRQCQLTRAARSVRYGSRC